MKTKETTKEKSKKFQTALTILQSTLILVLIVQVIFMMIEINNLQGTARVINYAGLVRGATQRLVKLELANQPNDTLISYLDEVLTELKHGKGMYELVPLHNSKYQSKLDTLIDYWSRLKLQIVNARNNVDYDATGTLVSMSETYFTLADETVSAAEEYSDKIAKEISLLEIVSAITMFFLIILIAEQTLAAMKIRKKNLALEKKAYIDVHTGLQNKNMCEELLSDKTLLREPVACIMFDINNLKITNDTLGHSTGDLLIADFARILKNVTRENDFTGRCGGDEFLMILYGIEDTTVSTLLKRLRNEVEHFNSLGKHIPISYAQGWAISSNYTNCTYRTLFDQADHNMYINKQQEKANYAKQKQSVEN